MKRERLEDKDAQPRISSKQVDKLLRGHGEHGRWTHNVAADLGVASHVLFLWLKEHGYRTEYSQLFLKHIVFPKPVRERL